MKNILVFIFFSVIIITGGFAQTSVIQDSSANASFKKGIFQTTNWHRPMWADMHSSITRIEISRASNSEEYNYGDNSDYHRPYVFSNIGADLPLWSGDFKNRKYSLGVSLPFSVDVWMDYFERSTAPIINTAYRIGGPEFLFMNRFEHKYWGIRNISLKLTPMKHESTHIGDELTIYRKDNNYSVTRVNVSYNYFEIGVMVNDPDGSLHNNHSFKFSYLRLLDSKAGWYNIVPQEGDVTQVPPSKSPYEWYVQYQYQSNADRRSYLQFIYSLEIRNRVKYGYPFFISDESDWDNAADFYKHEYRTYNINQIIGVRYNNPQKEYKVGIGFKSYLGQNPYGQFRSLPSYVQYGFCLLFEH